MTEIKMSQAIAEKLREKVRTTRGRHTEATLELSEALYETFYGVVLVAKKLVPVWEQWGHKSWEDYVEEEAGFHGQTAHRYRKVWEVFCVDLVTHVDVELLKQTSATRLHILTKGPLTKQNVNSWLKRAAAMSCCALEHAITGETEPYKTFTASLKGRDFEELKTILDVASEDREGNRAEILMEVVREWARMTNTSYKGRKKAA